MTSEEYAAAYQSGFNIAVRFFLHRGVSDDDALELVQAAWAKGWERRHQLRNPEAVLPWIISIARNIHKTTLRAPATISTEVIEVSAPVTRCEIDAQRLLHKSKPAERLLLEKFYVEGFRIREIAHAEGVSPGAIRLRLLRARRNANRGARNKQRDAVVS